MRVNQYFAVKEHVAHSEKFYQRTLDLRGIAAAFNLLANLEADFPIRPCLQIDEPTADGRIVTATFTFTPGERVDQNFAAGLHAACVNAERASARAFTARDWIPADPGNE